MKKLYFKELYDPTISLFRCAIYLPYQTLTYDIIKEQIGYLIQVDNEYNRNNVNKDLLKVIQQTIYWFLKFTYDKFIKTHFSTNISGVYFDTQEFRLKQYNMKKVTMDISDMDIKTQLPLITSTLRNTFRQLVLTSTTKQVFIHNISFDYDKYNENIERIKIWFFQTDSACVFTTQQNVININVIEDIRRYQLGQNKVRGF